VPERETAAVVQEGFERIRGVPESDGSGCRREKRLSCSSLVGFEAWLQVDGGRLLLAVRGRVSTGLQVGFSLGFLSLARFWPASRLLEGNHPAPAKLQLHHQEPPTSPPDPIIILSSLTDILRWILFSRAGTACAALSALYPRHFDIFLLPEALYVAKSPHNRPRRRTHDKGRTIWH
jgi:hypothetical protein